MKLIQLQQVSVKHHSLVYVINILTGDASSCVQVRYMYMYGTHTCRLKTCRTRGMLRQSELYWCVYAAYLLETNNLPCTFIWNKKSV